MSDVEQRPTTWPGLAPHAHAIADAVLRGDLEPEQIPIPRESEQGAWLSSIEQDVFRSAYAAAVGWERHAIGSEWGGFRLLRNLTDDNVTHMAFFLHGPLWQTFVSDAQNTRLQTLLSAFSEHARRVPWAEVVRVH